jgi:hypothetical protein
VCIAIVQKVKNKEGEAVFESMARDRELPRACAMLLFPTAVPCPGVGLGTRRYRIDTIARGPPDSGSPTQTHTDKAMQRSDFFSSVLYFISAKLSVVCKENYSEDPQVD